MTCTKNENAMEIQLSGLITWEKSLNFHETPQKGSTINYLVTDDQ